MTGFEVSATKLLLRRLYKFTSRDQAGKQLVIQQLTCYRRFASKLSDSRSGPAVQREFVRIEQLETETSLWGHIPQNAPGLLCQKHAGSS